MKRAISIGVLAVLATGFLMAVNFYLNHQAASGQTLLQGNAHYQPLCSWLLRDWVILWNDERTAWLQWTYIAPPPSCLYSMYGDFGDDYYWVQGITYSYYWEDWRRLYINYGQPNYQDIYFCFEDTPDRGGQ